MSDASAPAHFDLLETMKWTPAGGFFLLHRHMTRMQGSAQFFDYAWSEADIRRELDRAIAGRTQAQRIRLLGSRNGTIRVESRPLDPPSVAPARLGIATAPIDPANVFLFHKTTHRVMYTAAALPDCDDVALWNPDGDVTETTFGNVVVEMNGRKVTPPVTAGLLAGTFREELLERGEIVEGQVTLDDLKSATRVWLINSVREWWPATIQRQA